jgi:hypothetical protein
MFDWFLKPTKKAEEPLPEVVPYCAHDGRWNVSGTNTIGFGTCLECGQEVNLGVLLNNSSHRLQDLIAAYDKQLARAKGHGPKANPPKVSKRRVYKGHR